MTRVLSYLLLSLFFTTNIFADWELKPNIYSRGGLTLKEDLSKKAVSSGVFNLGAWNEESNAIAAPLTEVTLTAKYKNSVEFVYGVDVGNNERFIDQNSTTTPLNERLSYLTFFREGYSIWFGNRAYRGDGDFLTRAFPFDEHNMLGGGVRFENIKGYNTEFAYGIKENPESTQDKLINIFINKIEKPLSNGKLKTNLEVHKINGDIAQNDSLAYIAGFQWQRWGDKLFGGNLYNLALINYSNGYIYGGGMRSAYSNQDKDLRPNKIVVQWSGDLKFNNSALYYTFKYQRHGGANDNLWSFVDIHIRPMFAVSEASSIGADFISRRIIDDATNLNWGWNLEAADRIALIYQFSRSQAHFDLPTITILAGRMFANSERVYYSSQAASKAANFVRINYEISL